MNRAPDVGQGFRDPDRGERTDPEKRVENGVGWGQKNKPGDEQDRTRDSGAVGGRGRKLDRWMDTLSPHIRVSPVHLWVCARVGRGVLRGPCPLPRPGPAPSSPVQPPEGATRQLPKLLLVELHGGCPRGGSPRRSPRPRARAAASGFPGSAPARPAPPLRSGGKEAASAAAEGLSLNSASGAGRGRPRPPHPR